MSPSALLDDAMHIAVPVSNAAGLGTLFTLSPPWFAQVEKKKKGPRDAEGPDPDVHCRRDELMALMSMIGSGSDVSDLGLEKEKSNA